MLYSDNKTTCFGRQWLSSGFLKNKLKIVLYNSRGSVSMKRSLH